MQLAAFVSAFNLKLNITEQLAALMPVKQITLNAGIYEVKKVLRSLDVPMQKPYGLVTDVAPGVVGRNSGVSMVITNGVKNITSHDLIIFHCLMHQENLYTKCLKMMNVLKVVSKLVNFIRSEGLNHRRFKYFLSDVECKYGHSPYYTEYRRFNRV